MFEAWTNWQAIGFETPWVFWLALGFPIWLALSFFRPGISDWQARGQKGQKRFYHSLVASFMGQPQKSVRHLSPLWVWLAQSLRGLLLFLALLALAQPYRLEILPPEPPKQTLRDIVFVVESSVSFLLPDYQINGQAQSRMTVVKSVLDQFMAQLSGNRFGLILYADDAYRLMPLTADTEVARQMLKKLQPYLAGRNDAAMGEALGLGLDAQAVPSTTQNRIMVLISDGAFEASRLPLDEVIQYAQAKSMPIYTLGIGAGDAKADQRKFGGLLYQPLEEASMQRLAQETGGLYYRVGSGEDLAKMLAKIDQREGALLQPSTEKLEKVALMPEILIGLISVFALYGLLLVGLRQADV